jgi:LAO/AO transport system kinase
MNPPAALVDQVLAGQRLALARLITLLENEDPAGRAALDRLFAHTGRAHIIGVTGSPGAGKSSLVNQLARSFRHPAAEVQPLTVAIIAVDPTSPFTGGALLGDRVRMRDLAGDAGVFIRSMASRGALGGLARATAAAAQALDAAGFDVILIETVGAGQAEVDIARLAHTTLVVEAPGMGDDIQAIKAGILEIADILVVNKADRPGAENTLRALRGMLENGRNSADGWQTRLVATVATEQRGIAELRAAIDAHAAHLRAGSAWAERDQARLQAELEALVQRELVARWRAGLSPADYQQTLKRLAARELSPYQALEQLLTQAERGG